MPLTSTQTRALLAQLEIQPRKSLGQNFLTEGNLVRKSLALAAITPGDVVVEIGPGLGTLTEALLAAGAEVFAVELDPRLVAHLRSTLSPIHPEKFHLLEADAVEHPCAELLDTHPASIERTFKVVANLPYAVSTPWLDALLSGPLPERLVLMLQREAAERFTALPGTAERGAISIFTEAAYERDTTHSVSRKCFYPEPRVDSMLLSLTRKPNALAFQPETKKWIREFFTQRRKQIGALVRQLPSKLTTPNAKLATIFPAWLERLPALGLDARARPEDITLPAWLELNELVLSTL